jgi:hypothetical protein
MRTAPATALALAAVLGMAGATPRLARAQEAPAPAPPPPAPTAAASPEQLLAAADAAVDAGNLGAAAILYDQLARQHAASPQAGEARRALKIITAGRMPPPAPAVPQAAPPSEAGTVGVVIRREPYSLHTQERLRLTTWEKLDFGVTSFLYGMSVGFSFALSRNNPSGDEITAPIALGALGYTLGAVAYLKVGEPDRGDLPLALAITSFVPYTTLFVANIASDHPDERNMGLVTAATGVLSVPVAILAARQFDPDPGDMQLARDAGFWGMVLATTGTLWLGGETISTGFGGSFYQAPSNRKIFTGSLLGLYGGLGLGTIAALNSEVSLERVRVSTWGGYGGAVLGLLFGGVSADTDAGWWGGVTLGALAGLAITFAATSGLDGIPPEDVALRARRRPLSRLTPTLTAIKDVEGRARPAFGIAALSF